MERGIVPDEVIVLKEESGGTVLVERWNTLTRNGECDFLITLLFH